MSSAVPDAAGVRALADHWQLVVAGGGIAYLLLRGLVGALRLIWWNDKRVEHVVGIALRSEAFETAGMKIAEQIVGPLRAHLEDLTKRDMERKEAVQRAHQRIDDLGASTNQRIDTLTAQILQLKGGK